MCVPHVRIFIMYTIYHVEVVRFFFFAVSRRHKECDYIKHAHTYLHVYHARFHLISFVSVCGLQVSALEGLLRSTFYTARALYIQ